MCGGSIYIYILQKIIIIVDASVIYIVVFKLHSLDGSCDKGDLHV